jgi:hypothetical protein
MTILRLAPGLIAAASVLAPAAARAAETPLLVVVEAPPGLGLDGGDVRQTIGAELGTPVLAPRETEGGGPSDLMIVALDRGDIRMSLRGRTTPPLSRSIPMPPAHAARLQAIAWLAGNLARDQVSAIVGGAPAAAGVAASSPTAPPPLASATVASREPVETLSTTPAIVAIPPGPAPWAVSFAGGPAAIYLNDVSRHLSAGSAYYGGVAYQVEVQHQVPGGFLFGAALDVGPWFNTHLIGGAAFVGSGWYRRRVFAETTFGLGLEAVRMMVQNRTITAGSEGTTDTSTATFATQPLLYVRAIGTVGTPITPAFDLIARLTLHITSAETPFVSPHNQQTDYASLTIGVRLRLP